MAGEQSINFLNCCKMPPPSLLSLFPGFSCFPLSHNQQIRGKHTKINKAIELRSKEKELLSSSDRSVSVGAQIVALIQLLRGPVSSVCTLLDPSSWAGRLMEKKKKKLFQNCAEENPNKIFAWATMADAVAYSCGKNIWPSIDENGCHLLVYEWWHPDLNANHKFLVERLRKMPQNVHKQAHGWPLCKILNFPGPTGGYMAHYTPPVWGVGGMVASGEYLRVCIHLAVRCWFVTQNTQSAP